MDSLSQIVLGAAVGEVVLGRRIGNRAMVWGAVAGTIPDMDVLGKYFLSELDNLGLPPWHQPLAAVLCAGRLGLWVGDAPAVPQPHHAWMAVPPRPAAAVLIGFVVNFITQIVSPGGWWPVALYVPLAGAWLWRHAQKRYFQRRLDRHPMRTSRGGCSCFSGAF